MAALEGNYNIEECISQDSEDNYPLSFSMEESIISNETSDKSIDLNSSFNSDVQLNNAPFLPYDVTPSLIPKPDFSSFSNVSESSNQKRYSFGDMENEYMIECVSYTKSGEMNRTSVPRPVVATSCTEKTYKFVFTRKICEPVFTFAKGSKVIEKTRSLIEQFENDSELKVRKPAVDLDFINREAELSEQKGDFSQLRIDHKPYNNEAKVNSNEVHTPKVDVERKAVDASLSKRKQEIAEMIENVRQYLLKSPNVKHGTDRGAEICTANSERKSIGIIVFYFRQVS